MLIFKKGNAIKYLSEGSTLISILEKSGWVLEEEVKTAEEQIAEKKAKAPKK